MNPTKKNIINLKWVKKFYKEDPSNSKIEPLVKQLYNKKKIQTGTIESLTKIIMKILHNRI